MPEPTYREASPDDAVVIAVVGQLVWEELGGASGLPGPMTPEGVAARLASYGEGGAMFVCQSGHGLRRHGAGEAAPLAQLSDDGPAHGGDGGGVVLAGLAVGGLRHQAASSIMWRNRSKT